VLARVRAGVYRRRALGAGVGDAIGLQVGSGRLGAAEAIALPRAGSKLGLSALNCL
jgi:hypothetical protein